jgi:plasmid stability protein
VAILNLKNVPDPIYDKLKVRAKLKHRSMAQEVIHLLSETLDKVEPLSVLELQGLGKECWKDIDPLKHIEEERQSWD